MFSSRLTRHLERGVIGFPTTLASSVGVIMASPVILTVTSGFGMGGDTFALAVLLAFIMMQAQVTTFAEAATLIPTSGSVYDYIACGMGRFFAITGALCAYLIVHIFAGTAETILAGIMALVNFESLNAHLAAQQSSWMVGVGMVILFGLLNAIGVEIFGKAEVFLTFGMWFTLTVFGLCGVLMAPLTHLPGWFGGALNTANLSDLFSYVGMAMFMFVGCELVTPMTPEIRRAQRTIPRAMALGLTGVACCMFLYGAAINRQVVNAVVDAAHGVHLLDTPMAIPAFAERVMGKFGQYWLGAGLLLAGCATINTLMAAVPRILYGMALDGALPRILTWLHPRFKTPVVAIAIAVAIPCLHAWYLQGDVDRIVPLILAAVCAWGVAYLLVTLSVVLLRLRRPDLPRAYKSPLFPLPQILSSAGIVIAIINITPPGMDRREVLVPFCIMLGLTAAYALLWSRFVQKANAFTPLEVEAVVDRAIAVGDSLDAPREVPDALRTL
ncbi:APC family permease [Pluralibacter gergoviae]|uniref:APC family permease n=1 Tax=Pluralibacter gergoviae TaxID=61647 RepID=A0AAW8HLW3_PLUGE|nr:APC family permease [Pluralibacter gergoviae]AVR05086.1 APC family permease [Pluralibacter gergoviae]KJM56866.1 APC family amino acid permease [Pluralibacter gergoviae]KMK03556.1 APC family amino acid permease [Pluralibacter gergoviae]KMK26833.1 APC family amino acid permease [Pluralibacter gergoviae]MDQ2309007.1 APC family permease [Pluralibacter gergoviae]